MIIQKTNPVGLDAEVQRLQTNLYNTLGWSNYISYPLVYKTESEYGIRPELNIDGKNYKEVLYNDKQNATSFFISDDITDYNKTRTVNVSLIVQGNAKKLYPMIDHYADNEMQEDLIEAIRRTNSGFVLNTIERGIANVYREFDKELIKYSDIAPKHVIRFNFTISYGFDCR
jgi:hypothetical protein